MSNLATDISIHSFLYIFDNKKNKLVRVFWALVFFCSFSGFCFYFYSAFCKWQKSPDVVMDSREKVSKNFPFPAITLCSPLFARENLTIKFDEIERDDMKYTKSQCEYYAANSWWCPPKRDSFHYRFQNICGPFHSDMESMDILDLINNSAKTEQNFIINLNFIKMRRIFTSDGICFSYNMQV